ncbi:methylation-associated defense system protein kinase MAD6 [Krasilnikovia sp. MM14-A1259]|uniref:methylation-associated defense system protein kinase MAD6 n=1 Tax=Krasilnikovia sp. MM14-A1259 TaxID=3373539 RepID=UPI0038173405
MARIVRIGEPANDAERRVIAYLRDHGPDDWTVLHNFEVSDAWSNLFEIDLAVVTGHMVYVIDVKGTFGRIDVHGSRWMPVGRVPFHSPLPKLRENAKRVKALLEKHYTALTRVFVDAVVVLPVKDARLVDHNSPQRDAESTVNLQHLMALLSDVSRVPTGAYAVDADISRHHDKIVEAIQGVASVPSGPLLFGNWQVLETLSETQHAPGVDVVAEYRAKNANTVYGSGTVRLVVRQADLYAQAKERDKQQKQIGVAYEALGKLPAHPAIVGVRDFFPDAEDRGYVTVYDDVQGSALRVYLGPGATEPLTLDRKLLILRQVLDGLALVQSRRLVHRALSPATILLTNDGRAMITGFDYAKTAQPRAYTVALDAHANADVAYLSPETIDSPTKMSAKSDIYAVGVIGFELFTGHRPFNSMTTQVQARGVLPERALVQADVPPQLRHWLALLCARDPGDRPDAREALRRLMLAIGEVRRPQRRIGGGGGGNSQNPPSNAADTGADPRRNPGFWRHLERDYLLGTKYLVKSLLGKPGASGVAYRVYDSMRNVDRVVKLILSDPANPQEQARREGMVMDRLRGSTHPNVVKMVDVDQLPPPYSHPYLVFEYVEGKDLGEVIRSGPLTVADVLRIGLDVASGLAHIHSLEVWHCDIKPGNLLWTEDGVRILDFGIAKTPESTQAHTSNTPKYTPPDIDQVPATGAGFVDRDLFALGVTLYEALTGAYPWDASTPPPAVPAEDPRTRFTMPEEVPAKLVEIILKAIAPERGKRFTSAEEFLTALRVAAKPPTPLATIPQIRVDHTSEVPPVTARDELKPATSDNPFVAHLQTLYSQSRRSNRGTRGMDAQDYRVYVPTALDMALAPAVLNGAHSLVIVTGNAGDGKTAFLERLTADARAKGADFIGERPNGAEFELDGRRFRTNYDGSQDEEDIASDEVLTDFFAPFEGTDQIGTLAGETRLIAVNEGRLIDFLSHRGRRFAALTAAVEEGLRGEQNAGGVAVVNLNLRDVTVQPASTGDGGRNNDSILEQMLIEMSSPRFWEACKGCVLIDSCYARRNATTIASPVIGAQVRDRLRRIYEIAQLRGRLHITLRDLRSALAYTITSGRDCTEIHRLYKGTARAAILESQYFNSYRGGAPEVERDRLLVHLREVDVAAVPQPVLDRRLAAEGLLEHHLITPGDRSNPVRALLKTVHDEIIENPTNTQATTHYVATARRLTYFEMRDSGAAAKMLPYSSARSFLDYLDRARPQVEDVLRALNRSEGVISPEIADGGLVIRVRDVVGGTVRSLRRFPKSGFTAGRVGSHTHPYLETRPNALKLTYTDPVRAGAAPAELRIGLDLFELIERFRRGYQASVEDDQGYGLAVTVFKNQLAAAPYQEVLLTVDGALMHTVSRTGDGVLHLATQTADIPDTEEAEWR